MKVDLKRSEIGKKLARKNLSQNWLAEKLGKSFSIVNAYACNRRQPSLEVLYQIANLLQVDVKDLLISNVNSSKKN